MAWVLWDIFIPLLIAFGLGALFGWLMWKHKQPGESDQLASDAGVIVHQTDEGMMAVDEQATSPSASNIDELEQANIVLIGERDTAVAELETLQNEFDGLSERVQELESSTQNDEISTEAPGFIIDTRPEFSDDEKQKLNKEIDNLQTQLEQQRTEKREAELALLNAKNDREKFETRLRNHSDDSEWRQKYEQLEPQSVLIQNDLSELEVNHAKLQADYSEQQRVNSETQQLSEDKDKEIAELKARLESQDEDQSQAIEMISVDQHQQQIESLDTQVANLKRQLELQESREAPPIASVLPENLVSEDSTKLETEESTLSVQEINSSDNDHQETKAPDTAYKPDGWSIPERAPSKKERDDLTEIKGVGPVLEKLLHKSGIYYFQQVASLDKNGVDELQEQIPQFPGRIRRDGWVRQAKKLQREKHGTALT